jgi:hypothetical protein
MARRRRRRAAPRRRVVYSRRAAPRRRRSRRTGGKVSTKAIIKDVAMGGGYGLVRGPMNQLIAPITKKIPVLGNLGDEAALLIADVLIARNSRGMIRDLASTGVKIEAFAIGSGLGSMLVGNLMGGETVTTTQYPSFR